MSYHISSDQEFIEVVKSSINTHQALMKLGLQPKGGSYTNFKRRCEKLQIDTSHFMKESEIKNKIKDVEFITALEKAQTRKEFFEILNLNEANKSNNIWLFQTCQDLNLDANLISRWDDQFQYQFYIREKKKELKDLFVPNGTPNSHKLKLRLIKEGYFENRCYTPDCVKNEWHGKPLSLHLEHINGDHCDNRLENLTLLCPNCHSQTATYSRAKSSFVEKKIVIKYCIDCGINITPISKRCQKCSMLYNKANAKTKINWPKDKELLEMLSVKSYLAVSRELGVSDNAIRKRLSKRGLLKKIH